MDGTRIPMRFHAAVLSKTSKLLLEYAADGVVFIYHTESLIKFNSIYLDLRGYNRLIID